MCYIFLFAHSLLRFVCGHHQHKIKHTAEKCRSEAEKEARGRNCKSSAFFFRGRMCKLTGKIICACACQRFSPFASFKASLFNFFLDVSSSVCSGTAFCAVLMHLMGWRMSGKFVCASESMNVIRCDECDEITYKQCLVSPFGRPNRAAVSTKG